MTLLTKISFSYRSSAMEAGYEEKLGAVRRFVDSGGEVEERPDGSAEAEQAPKKGNAVERTTMHERNQSRNAAAFGLYVDQVIRLGASVSVSGRPNSR